MKIQYLSDLHLEYGPLRLIDTGADVLILAGDFVNGCAAKPARFFTWLDAELAALAVRPAVLLVLGNHDYYRCRLEDLETFRAAAATRAGIFVLDNESVEIDGVRFLGSTLWTNFDLFGNTRRRFAMYDAEKGMNDFKLIRHREYRRIKPLDVAALNFKANEFLASALALPYAGRTVVITHFAPHPGSVIPDFETDDLTPYYVNDLGELLEEGPDLWIHGHTHHCFDYVVGKTRILANPRGYGKDEDVEGFDAGKVITL